MTNQQKFNCVKAGFMLIEKKPNPDYYQLVDTFGKIHAEGNYALCNFVKARKPMNVQKCFKIVGVIK